MLEIARSTPLAKKILLRVPEIPPISIRIQRQILALLHSEEETKYLEKTDLASRNLVQSEVVLYLYKFLRPPHEKSIEVENFLFEVIAASYGNWFEELCARSFLQQNFTQNYRGNPEKVLQTLIDTGHLHAESVDIFFEWLVLEYSRKF